MFWCFAMGAYPSNKGKFIVWHYKVKLYGEITETVDHGPGPYIYMYTTEVCIMSGLGWSLKYV